MTPKTCSRCGTPGEGAFCSSCGAPLGERRCGSCGALANPGAGYCANCGTRLLGNVASSAPAAKPDKNIRNWGGVRRLNLALVGLALAAVVWAAIASRGTAPDGAPATGAPTAGGTVADGTPPDISNLTPQQRFLRLADRVQSAVQQGDTATVVRFFPMVEAAYDALTPEERDLDSRFHLSLLQAEVGHFEGAEAQADTIEAAVPKHLLAHYLRALIADFKGDVSGARSARAAFRADYDAEIATARPEYVAHQTLLKQFLDTTPNP